MTDQMKDIYHVELQDIKRHLAALTDQMKDMKDIYHVELQDIKRHLAAHGIICADIYDLRAKELERAAPLLLDLLPKLHSPSAKAALIRVASDTKKIPLAPLLEELRRIRPLVAHDMPHSDLAWAITDTLSKIAPASMADEIFAMIRDRALGTARRLLLDTLVRFKKHREQAIALLMEIMADPDLTSMAISTSARMKVLEAIPAIQKHHDSPGSPLIKRSALKALKKLGSIAAETAGATHSKPVPRSTDDVPAKAPMIFDPENDLVAEASMNFDPEDVVPFLTEISTLMGDFGEQEIKQIDDHLLTAEEGDESSFEFEVTHDGKPTLLQIVIYMSDEDAPDVAFFSTRELAKAITQRLEKWNK